MLLVDVDYLRVGEGSWKWPEHPCCIQIEGDGCIATIAQAVLEAPDTQREMFKRIFRFVFVGEDVSMYNGTGRLYAVEPFGWLPRDVQVLKVQQWVPETFPPRHFRWFSRP